MFSSGKDSSRKGILKIPVFICVQKKTSMAKHLGSYILRCRTGTYLPSANSLQSASRGRPGTLWEHQPCSEFSRLCLAGTGHTSGVLRSQGQGIGILVGHPAAGRPRKGKRWWAAGKNKDFNSNGMNIMLCIALFFFCSGELPNKASSKTRVHRKVTAVRLKVPVKRVLRRLLPALQKSVQEGRPSAVLETDHCISMHVSHFLNFFKTHKEHNWTFIPDGLQPPSLWSE